MLYMEMLLLSPLAQLVGLQVIVHIPNGSLFPLTFDQSPMGTMKGIGCHVGYMLESLSFIMNTQRMILTKILVAH